MPQLALKTHVFTSDKTAPFLVVCYDRVAFEKMGYQALAPLTTIRFPRQNAVAAFDHINGLMLIDGTREQEQAVTAATKVAWKTETLVV